MTQASANETAEKLNRRRTRALPALAVVLVTQQVAFVTMEEAAPDRSVDVVRLAAWLILSAVLLAALATKGFWFRSRAVRDLLDDEGTRAHRFDAMRVGFVCAMAGSMLLSVITLAEPVTARQVIHLLLSIGLGAAILRWAFLERRANRDG